MPKDIIISEKLPAPKGPYSPAVRANGFVFVSGQGPIDARTGEVFRGEIKEQTRLALENVRAILEAAGSSMAKVVKTNVYLTDIAEFAAMNEVYAGFFPSEPPARTTIQARALPLGIGVEVDAVALT
jgi:2-iminobutanoate/2-iminopropanoate deaminase